MKKLFATSVLLFSTLAQAGIITITPGSTVTLTPLVESTVVCSGSTFVDQPLRQCLCKWGSEAGWIPTLQYLNPRDASILRESVLSHGSWSALDCEKTLERFAMCR